MKYYSDISHLIRPSQLKYCPRVKFKGMEFNIRKLEVLECIAQGLTNTEIAQRLRMSTRTVENHIGGIRKLLWTALGNRIRDRELVLFARDLIYSFSEIAAAKDLYYLENLDFEHHQHMLEAKFKTIKVRSGTYQMPRIRDIG
jgi:hypothetical protein